MITMIANHDLDDLYLYAQLQQDAVADIKLREPSPENKALPEEIICVALDVMEQMGFGDISYEVAREAFVMGVMALVTYRKAKEKIDDQR